MKEALFPQPWIDEEAEPIFEASPITTYHTATVSLSNSFDSMAAMPQNQEKDVKK